MADNIISLFDQAVQDCPDRIYMIENEKQISYADVDQQVKRIANVLTGQGILPGQTVAIMLPNSISFGIATLAVLKMGAVAAPLNSNAPSPEIENQINDLNVAAVISSDSFLPLLEDAGVFKNCPVLFWSESQDSNLSSKGMNLNQLMAEASEDFDAWQPEQKNLALLLNTSGTTGKPKAVQLTHKNVIAMLQGLDGNFWQLQEDDVLLQSAPVNTIFAQSIFLGTIIAKATLTILPRITPQSFMQVMMRDKVTFFPGVPMMAQMMMKAPPQVDPGLSSLRRVMLSGMALSLDLAMAFEERFGAKVLYGYGMTEAVPISKTNDLSGTPKGSVGKAAEGIEISIIDENSNILPAGQTGEILIKGPQVFTGYYNAPELNAAILSNGWYHTGDAGYLDENGYLFLVDRVKDIIKTAGHTIYPAEVEAVLKEHPAIFQAAVVGKPHEGVGEVVQAFVVLKPESSATAQEIIAFCKERLAAQKCPRKIHFRDSLPMSPSGKVLKKDLV